MSFQSIKNNLNYFQGSLETNKKSKKRLFKQHTVFQTYADGISETSLIAACNHKLN